MSARALSCREDATTLQVRAGLPEELSVQEALIDQVLELLQSGERPEPESLLCEPDLAKQLVELPGGVLRVEAALVDVSRRYATDELGIVTICYDAAARVRSYELVASLGISDRTRSNASKYSSTSL